MLRIGLGLFRGESPQCKGKNKSTRSLTISVHGSYWVLPAMLQAERFGPELLLCIEATFLQSQGLT